MFKGYDSEFLQEWLLYRPVLAKVVTLTELNTTVDIDEVIKINKMLDLNDKIKGFFVSEIVGSLNFKGNKNG